MERRHGWSERNEVQEPWRLGKRYNSCRILSITRPSYFSLTSRPIMLYPPITNGHLLICDLILGYSKRLRKQGLDSDDGLCTRTEHHMLLPIVLYIVVPLCLKMQ